MIKKLFIVLVFLSIFFVTGCWNYDELNQLAICSGMAIDKDNDEYKVSLMISNSKKYQVSSKEGESQKVVYSAKGKTIDEAVRNINLESPKKVYLGHLSIILVSEEVAKDGMLNIMDYLIRNPESTKRFLLALVKDSKAYEVLQIISPLEAYPSQDLTINLKVASDLQAISSAVNFSQFVEAYIKKGTNPSLPTIVIEGDAKDGTKDKSLEQATPDAIAKLSTIAIFKEDKLVDIASEEESEGINLLAGRIKKMIVTTECDNNYLSTEIKNIKTSLKIKFKNNKPVIYFNFKGVGAIEEFMCSVDIRDTKTIDKINNDLNNEIAKIITAGYKVAQENKTDIFEIGNLIYKKNPKYFNKIMDSWDDEIFPNTTLNMNINLNLKSKGSLEQTIKEAKNEGQ